VSQMSNRMLLPHDFEDMWRTAVRKALDQGWVIERIGSTHVRWTSPSGVVIMSSRNNRQYDWIVRKLIRSGLDLQAEYRKPQPFIQAVVYTPPPEVPIIVAQPAPPESTPKPIEETMPVKRRNLTEFANAVITALAGAPGTIKVDQLLEKVIIKFPFADSVMVSKACRKAVENGNADIMGRGLYKWNAKKKELVPVEVSPEEELQKVLDDLLSAAARIQEWATKAKKRYAKDAQKVAKMQELVKALNSDDEG
jgi:hypothetical protein